MCMYLKCDDCGVTDDKAVVEETFCPFAKEVHGEDVEMMLCEECYQQRAWDV